MIKGEEGVLAFIANLNTGQTISLKRSKYIDDITFHKTLTKQKLLELHQGISEFAYNFKNPQNGKGVQFYKGLLRSMLDKIFFVAAQFDYKLKLDYTALSVKVKELFEDRTYTFDLSLYIFINFFSVGLKDVGKISRETLQTLFENWCMLCFMVEINPEGIIYEI